MYRRTDGWEVNGHLKSQSISHTIYISVHTPHWLKLSSICVLHMHSHMYAAHIWLRWFKSKKKKSINNRESVKGSFIALLFVFIFLASGHCLSVLQSFRFYIYKAFPPGRQLKWPWNQSDQTHQWGIKCCWLMFTAVTGKCLSNWNINDAGNENRKTFFFLCFWNKNRQKK